jgi:CubicO group peptidase (beta-lactamase class C family)
MRPGDAQAVIRRAAVAAIGLVCFAAFAGDAGTVSIEERLDAYLRGATARGDFNGTVLVVRDGRVLLRKGYGYADVAARTPNRPATRFRISSLTGDITQIALLQLVERGRLSLDDSSASTCGRVPRPGGRSRFGCSLRLDPACRPLARCRPGR